VGRSLRALLALATTLAGAEAAAAGGLPSELGLSGSIAADYFSSNHDLDDREHFPGVNLVVKQRVRMWDRVRWVAEARFLAQQVGHEEEDADHWSPRALRYDDEVVSELREGYVELGGKRWEARLGRQIIVWGRADEINPTDVVTPKNYRLLLPEGQPAQRFGVTAAQVDYFLDHGVRLTGVWVPLFAPTDVPLESPSNARVERQLPPITFENGSAGVKLDRSGGDVDASLAYFYGFNLLPEARIDRIRTDPVSGELGADASLRHSRQHMIGADFATAAGRFSYRGEVAYVHTDNPHGRRLDAITPYLFYVLGLERRFSGDAGLIVQYVGRYIVDRVDPARALADPDPALGQARYVAARETVVINQQLDTVQNGWSLRLDKQFWNQTLDCELLGVHYFERNDFFIRPTISYALADGWEVSVGGEIFHGPKQSFFGRVEDNTGAFTELKYSF
jgi:hypothetical protein